ncbi:TRAP transporter substrate-binding protein [Caenimonas soli]|uniref:TRAP transporter substrate-binding protein n=1 Tax=Caenimonas soli TaxID=2735555 RepID=UPI001552DDE4|nr:TRAP transporter substrate-binding protein [Caenimonas soli]NPC57312.1 TRAP transporter substrate-binding protein [Caenimonas soli]
MTISRRKLIQGVALSAAATAAPVKLVYAQGAEFTYKYANNTPLTHPMNIRAKQAADAIRAETNGRLDIQIFPSSQLGSDTDTLSQLRSGGVEFFTLSGLILSTLVPPAALNGLGFAFPNYDTVWRAMDGDVGAYVRAQIAKVNLVAMDKIWDNGFRQITTSTKSITNADDLRGLKIRVPVSPMWTSMFKAFDSSPASINASEMYTALQTKVVDAQENPISVVSLFKLNEVQKYCSLTNHMWDGFWFLANRRAWERLPPNLREIASKHLNAAAVSQRADVATLNGTLQQELAAKGMVFNAPKTDSFRDKLRSAGFYAEWKAKFGDEAWATLEKYTGKLG